MVILSSENIEDTVEILVRDAGYGNKERNKTDCSD
jgi:hypothetical protein